MDAVNTRSQEGFALPLVLMVIGLVAIGVIMAIPSSAQLSLDRRLVTAQTDVQRVGVSAESRVKFLLLTEPVGLNGLEIGGPKLGVDGTLVSGLPERRRSALIFDARPYRVELANGNQAIIRVQDEGGLINVTYAEPRLVANLLAACGLDRARAQRLAADLARYRSNSPGDGRGSEPLDIRKARGWNGILSGDFGREIQFATSNFIPANSLSALTAPPSVLTALFDGDRVAARDYFRKRATSQVAINMNIKYDQTEYKNIQSNSKTRNKQFRMRLYVEIDRTELTAHLPVYFYETAIDIDTAAPSGLLMSNRAVFNAGNWSNCHQFIGEDLAPRPLMGAASF
ncbi:hypothetical protein OKA06_00840 [Novosphingobium sp. MW5]|nr:hypothetical protein [Novosphingobium sp. MW5]